MVETVGRAPHPAASRRTALDIQTMGLTRDDISIDSIQDGGADGTKLFERQGPSQS